jgi:asparagine synthetase B (glutamine-hydrolysing)
MRRLAIVDPASGKQPLLSEDKNLVLLQMVRFTTTESCKQFEENTTSNREKVIVKLF